MDQARHARTVEIAAALARLECQTAVNGQRGYPPLVGVTQWAGESKWGAKVTGDLNFWGIKAKAGQSKKFCPTREWLTAAQFAALAPEVKASVTRVGPPNAKGQREYYLSDWFASYATLDESVAAYHAFFLENQRYHPTLAAFQQHGDPERCLIGICEAGYATDPGYRALLVAISRQSDVRAIVEGARRADRIRQG